MLRYPKISYPTLFMLSGLFSYADEALREKQPRRQAEAGRLYASAGSPKEKGQATPESVRPGRTRRKEGRNRNRSAGPGFGMGLLGFSST